MTHEERLQADLSLIEGWLSAYFAGCPPRSNLCDAMRYSLLAGGKRIRPVLTLEACRLCGGTAEDALPFACAVEMVHTYSLIHDDLPCMDNDDLRRGRPTNHKVYGEATAVLAGDALLTAAFEVLAGEGAALLPPERVMEAVSYLAEAAGVRGMVGGQALDMAAEGRALSADEMRELQSLKTGALITAAVSLGCIAAGAGEETRAQARAYAGYLGLAFQVRDDILDVKGDELELGKPVGSDIANEKSTFATLLGVDRCRTMVEQLTGQAVQSIASIPGSGFLCWLAGFLADRKT